MAKLVKPKKTFKGTYLYNECRNYLQFKYGYQERDYGRRYEFEGNLLKEFNKKYKDDSWFHEVPSNHTPEQMKIADEYSLAMKNRPEYLDFWHWVVDHYDIHNGCFIVFDSSWLNCDNDLIESWQKEIYKYYIDEFADENGELEMWVSW